MEAAVDEMDFVESHALEALKVQLGQQGRADFQTRVNDVGADLIWRRERVAFWVRPCIWYGCPKHGDQVPERLRGRAETLQKLAKKAFAKLSQARWMAIEMFECEIVQDPRVVAEKLAGVLKSRESLVPTKLIELKKLKRISWAQLASLDAISKCSRERWIDFLRMISHAPVFRKGDIEFTFINRKGRSRTWTKPMFDSVWACALYHGVINYDNNGYFRGKLFEEVARDMGVKSKEEEAE